MHDTDALKDADYRALADFRHALRLFTTYSETAAAAAGLAPQQHQALLSIRAASVDDVTIGYVATRLVLKPHSASGLIDRLEASNLVVRCNSDGDKRRSLLRLTPEGEAMLAGLSSVHRDEIARLRPMLTEMLDRFG